MGCTNEVKCCYCAASAVPNSLSSKNETDIETTSETTTLLDDAKHNIGTLYLLARIRDHFVHLIRYRARDVVVEYISLTALLMTSRRDRHLLTN